MSSQFKLLLLGCLVLGLDLCRNCVLSLNSFLSTQELLVLNLSTLIQTVCIVFIPLKALLKLILLNLRIYLLSCLLLSVLTLDGLLMCLCLSLGDLLCDWQLSLYPVLTLLLLYQSLLVKPTLLLDPSLVIYEPTLLQDYLRLEYLFTFYCDLPFAFILNLVSFGQAVANYWFELSIAILPTSAWSLPDALCSSRGPRSTYVGFSDQAASTCPIRCSTAKPLSQLILEACWRH